MSSIFTTSTTEQTLSIIESYKAARIPLNQAREEVTDLLEEAIAAIEANPLQYPVDLHAQAQGVLIRRWMDSSGKYTCLFRYNPTTDTAILDIFASTHQDYLSLLYMVQISRP